MTQTPAEIAAIAKGMTDSERVRRTMTDHGRLLWRDDVEAACPHPDMCFDYGETVRCGPCAIKAAQALGIETNMTLPDLPEVSRLRRELAQHLKENGCG
jgi:hypothetical protein